MKPTFLTYRTPVCMVLDDNPDLPVKQILAFEHACRFLLDHEACLVYRDWLEENDCTRRYRRMNDALAAEVVMLERLAHVIEQKDRTDDDPQAKAWLDNRIVMLKQALAGHEACDDNGIDGVGVVYFPPDLQTGQMELQQANIRNMIENIRAGSCIALPSDCDHHGNRRWDFRIEAGHPGQVITRRTNSPEPSVE